MVLVCTSNIIILELCLLVDNAFGITVDICGPTSLRRSDLHLLRDSAINDRLAHVQFGEELQYTIFGDSAYPELSHLGSYQGRSRAYCSAMKKVRISIEWNYATTGSLFKYIHRKILVPPGVLITTPRVLITTLQGTYNYPSRKGY